MHFGRNPFTCSCEAGGKAIMTFKLALLLVVFRVIAPGRHGSERVNVHRNHKPYLEQEERGRGRGSIYQSLHYHHQNDSCIKMGSDESHFNVSLNVRDKVTRQCPQTTTYLKRKQNRSGIKPRPFCLPALPLGQTGSLEFAGELNTEAKYSTRGTRAVGGGGGK